ncbi:MAG TPA: radical SAM protein [Candidatus Hydrogenedentes bacterium]|nr:radical SAM protein [Candidatus Hydrogenedentota bacterium]HPG65596.1 radical SAM protein [Candidatus Hydrogenedentota bacterium]
MGLLYTQTKIFHFPEKLASLRRESGEILPPIHIRLKPTNACNHRCRYCAYTADNLQLGQDMSRADSIPRDKMRAIVEDIIAMGVKAVTFTGGGEPFCYPYLEETAGRLADSPVRFASLTNGSRLAGSVAEVFARHGTWIRVSMDGWDGPSYAAFRGVDEGEFDRVLNNMERFKAIGGPCYLGVNYVVGRENAPHVFAFIRRVRDLGVDSIKLSPCIVSNNGAENNRYHAPFFADVDAQITRAQVEFQSDRFEIFNAYHRLQETFEKSYAWCPYVQILPVIGADLRVYTCRDKAYNLETGLVGSLETEGFRDFWMNGKDKFFRVRPSRDCNHHCGANAINQRILEYLDADREHLDFV